MGSKTVVDEEALKECMNGISRALMAADVNIRLVTSLVTNVRNKVRLGELGGGIDRRKVSFPCLLFFWCLLYLRVLECLLALTLGCKRSKDVIHKGWTLLKTMN